MNNCNYVYNNIKALRKNKGLTQSVLAQKIGVVKPYISMIEAGKSRISVELLLKIAAALEVHPQALLEDNEKRVFSHSFEGLAAYADELYKYHGSLKKRQAELDTLLEKYKNKIAELEAK